MSVKGDFIPAEKAPSVVSSRHSHYPDDDDDVDEVFKMRLAVSAHHTNPRSPTLVGWKNSMPIEEYRVVRNQKRKQKNIPDSSAQWKEQHLIIAHRLAELEKRRVGTRYLPKGQEKADPTKDEPAACLIS